MGLPREEAEERPTAWHAGRWGVVSHGAGVLGRSETSGACAQSDQPSPSARDGGGPRDTGLSALEAGQLVTRCAAHTPR